METSVNLHKFDMSIDRNSEQVSPMTLKDESVNSLQIGQEISYCLKKKKPE